MKQHPTIELLESLNIAVIYLIESAACMAVLYLLYHFFLRNEKSFNYNRAYLLVALFISVSFPMMEFTYNPANTPGFFNSLHQIGNGVGSEPIIEAERAYSYTITAKSERPFLLWWEALLVLYVAGVSIGLLKLFIRIREFKEVIWYKRHNTRFKKNFFLVNTEGMMPTFSFFNYLFWDNSQEYTELEKEQILAHEKAHIDQKHSYDILFIEILKVVFWFNPLMYLYKRLLEEVHEYAADRTAIGKNSPALYSQLLVKTVFKKMGLEYGSYFGKNKTLKRLNMMKKVASTNYFKLLLPVPFIALLLFIFSFDAIPEERVEIQDYVVQSAENFHRAPEPTDGIDNWKSFLENNIAYPKDANSTASDSELIISFNVNRAGYLESLSFNQEIGLETERAVIDALQKSSRWKPASKDGQSVTSRVEVPIVFKKS